VTQPARGTATPLFDGLTETDRGQKKHMAGFGSNVSNIAHFPQKSMIYTPFPGLTATFWL